MRATKPWSIFVPILLLFFMVAGCGTTPPIVPLTMNEKIAAAEVTYEAAVSSVRDLLVQGVIKKGTPTADKMASAIILARTSLDAWGLFPNDPDAQGNALGAIKALQFALTSLKGTLQ